VLKLEERAWLKQRDKVRDNPSEYLRMTLERVPELNHMHTRSEPYSGRFDKLTQVVKDRVVQSFQLNPSELLIGFIDGSVLKVKIVESNSPPLREGAGIRQISEDQAKLSSSVRTTAQSA
jgi:hypothetical protein